MFRRYLAMMESNFLRIPKATIAAALLIPLYFMISRGLATTIGQSVWENLFCEPFLLNLWIPIADLVLLAGIGVAREDDATRFVRMKTRGRIVAGNLITAAVLTVCFLCASLLIFLLYFCLLRGMRLTNAWSQIVLMSESSEYSVASLYPAPVVFHAFSPIGAVMMQMLYLFLYCFFLSVASMAINVLFKRSVGSIITVFAMMANAFFGKQESGFYSFFPSYNGNFKKLTEINQFVFSRYALLYWLVLISAAVIVYAIVMYKTDLIGLSREDRT